MPTSKKRVRKEKQEVAPVVSKNLVKKPWARVLIVVLALSFVLSGLVGLIYVLIMAMSA